MKAFLTLLFLLGTLTAFPQSQISINGGLNLPVGQFGEYSKTNERKVASTGYQLGLDWFIRFEKAFGIKLSFGYGRNPIDKEAYRTAERHNMTGTSKNWDILADPYSHHHFLFGPNFTHSSKTFDLHFNALMGALHTRFPYIKAVAVLNNNEKFTKERESGSSFGFGYNFNFEVAYKLNKQTSFNLTFGYFTTQQEFRSITVNESIEREQDPVNHEFSNDYKVNVKFFVIKTGIGFRLN